MRGKPIQFWFKPCCLASSDGYFFNRESYCESDSKLRDTGLGQGGDVVSDLIEKCDLQSVCRVTCGILFTSLPLLDVLVESGIVDLYQTANSVSKSKSIFKI